MPKSAAERLGIPLGPTDTSSVPHPEDPAWREWLAHVDSGRIGSGAGTTRRQLANHIRNEMILLGRGKL